MTIHITHSRREVVEGRFEKDVRWLLDHAYDNAQFFTISEIAKYKPSEDKTVWDEARGYTKEVVEVYHKGEWLCDVDSKMSRNEIINRVTHALRKQIKAMEEKLLKEKGVKP